MDETGDHSAFVITAILVMFLIYVTAKGELGTWISLLLWSPNKPKEAAQSPPPPAPGQLSDPSTLSDKPAHLTRKGNLLDLATGKITIWQWLMGNTEFPYLGPSPQQTYPYGPYLGENPP